MRTPFFNQFAWAASDLSVAVQWKLVHEVFADRKAIVVCTVIMVLVAAFSDVSGGPAWLNGLGCAAVVVMVARLWLVRAFRRRDPRDPPALWAWRYAYGAWAVAAIWGSAGIAGVTSTNGYVQFVAVTAHSALLIGAAVRNCNVPQAAVGQTFITLGPLFLDCLCSARIEYQLYSVLVGLHIVFALQTTKSLRHRTERLLRTEEAMSETVARLADANERLASLALTDGLTGIPNRRGLDEALEREWRRAQREHAQLSFVLFDIDHFKLLNDTRGHLVGDDYLRRVAGCLHASAQRPADLVARFGGEEFAVLLPDTDAAGAVRTAERLRAAIEALALPHPASPYGIVTVSGGVVTALPGADCKSAGMLALADKALYSAKAGGRNRVQGTELVARTAAATGDAASSAVVPSLAA